MNDRYLGEETCTSVSQVVRYLTENYVDAAGVPMPRAIAADIADKGAEQIRRGIEIFRSNVEYLGDEALRNSARTGWTCLPYPEDDDGDV